MIESGFINGDCMEYLKEYPDNYFDLCIADPPYGDGGVISQTAHGLANVSTAINRGGVARQAEISPRDVITHSDSARGTRITRTGGTWATKYAKKL